MIVLGGMACALLVDLWVIWPVQSPSLPEMALAATTLYAGLVLLFTSAVFVVGLRRVRMRIAQPPETYEQ
jgi:hypothetical protein